MDGEQRLIEHEVGQAAVVWRQRIPIQEGDPARDV